MKITQITVYQRDLTLKDPYWLSGGRLRFDLLDATFVKIETDEGITGWGEGTPWGHAYSPIRRRPIWLNPRLWHFALADGLVKIG